MPRTPASRRGRVPDASTRPSRYGSLETSTTAPVSCSTPSAPVQRRSSAWSTWAEHCRHGVGDRPELRVAVSIALHRFGVDTERHVVHEHPAIDLGQVHEPLAPLRERVERADDIVAIDAEVQREMITGPSRHTHVRKPPLGGDRGDDRLRAVSAGHADRVGAAVDRIVHQRGEIISEMKLDRLDAAGASLARDMEALGLPPTRFRVVEQHRPLRRRRGRSFAGTAKTLRAAATDSRNVARINASSSTRPSITTSATAPASNTPAPADPAARAGPR